MFQSIFFPPSLLLLLQNQMRMTICLCSPLNSSLLAKLLPHQQNPLQNSQHIVCHPYWKEWLALHFWVDNQHTVSIQTQTQTWTQMLTLVHNSYPHMASPPCSRSHSVSKNYWNARPTDIKTLKRWDNPRNSSMKNGCWSCHKQAISLVGCACLFYGIFFWEGHCISNPFL